MRQDSLQKVIRAYHFFKANIDNEISLNNIAINTGWKISSVKTYYSKKWAGIFLEINNGVYLICMPDDLTENQFIQHHSQVDEAVKI